MKKNELTTAFDESLKEETLSCVSEFAELGLDSILDDGILKDVPLVGTVVGVYKIGRTISERVHIKKLIKFLEAIKNNTVDESTRDIYRKKIIDADSRDQEIEYLLVILDKYTENEKASLLAKMYLAYLDGTVKWEEFRNLSAILDKILPYDIETLKEVNNLGSDSFIGYLVNSSLQRLMGVGLIASTSVGMSISQDGHLTYRPDMIKNKQEEFVLTEYGKKFNQTIFG